MCMHRVLFFFFVTLFPYSVLNGWDHSWLLATLFQCWLYVLDAAGGFGCVGTPVLTTHVLAYLRPLVQNEQELFEEGPLDLRTLSTAPRLLIKPNKQNIHMYKWYFLKKWPFWQTIILLYIQLITFLFDDFMWSTIVANIFGLVDFSYSNTQLNLS